MHEKATQQDNFKLKVLLLSTRNTNKQSIIKILQQLHADEKINSFTTTSTSSEARNLIADHKYQIFISDQIFGDEDILGNTLCAELKKLYPKLYTIVLSKFPDIDSMGVNTIFSTPDYLQFLAQKLEFLSTKNFTID